MKFNKIIVLINTLLWLFSLEAFSQNEGAKKIGEFAVTAWVCLFSGPLLLLGSFIFDGNTIISTDIGNSITQIYLVLSLLHNPR